jgi:glycosyltransferase involved in cell wall biosynthesis
MSEPALRLDELRGSESRSRTVARLSFEVSDLIYYYGSGNTPTGIQRVQQELASQYLQRGAGQNISFVIYDSAVQRWKSVNPEWLGNLISTARSFRGGPARWREEYRRFAERLSTFPLSQFERGDWLVNVGASWSMPSYFIQIRQLKRRGVRCAFFVHDCIPVRHPAYFEYHHTIEHSYWLFQVRETADLVICNSEATRADYLEITKPDNVDDVRVSRLDASWIADIGSAEIETVAADALAEHGIFDEEFVLCVGTIEPRKNHITLIHVWDRLRNTHPESCPKLLCVGRIGWKSDAVISQAKALGLNESHIIFTGPLSDEVLAFLYKKCMFSVYLSYYEGWGLPVTESLHVGKICIAGSSAALREAGAGHVVHVDERSETSVYDAVTKLITNELQRTSAERKIRETYRPRSWGDIGTELHNLCSTAGAAKTHSAALPVLDMNTLYRFGRLQPLASFDNPAAAEIFCVGHAWHQPESWGIWTSKETAELGFRVERSALPATVFLAVLPPPGGANLTISIDGKQVRAFANVSVRKIIRLFLKGDTSDAGSSLYMPVRLRTTVNRVQSMREVASSQDDRQLGLGFLFIVGFDGNALLERLEFMERIVTGDLDTN